MGVSLNSNEELSSVVESMLDVPHFFGWLTPTGATLAAGEVRAVPGDLRATITAWGDPGGRRLASMKSSMANGRCRVRNFPTPILWDKIQEVPYALSVESGKLGLVTPTFGESESDSFAQVDS